MNNKMRIVITGIGVISPIGTGKEAFWEGLSEGRFGISKITAFDTSEFQNHRGGEIKDFYPKKYIQPEKLGKIGRTSQYAVAATKMALEDAGIRTDGSFNGRIGISLGTTMGETQMLEQIDRTWAKNGEEVVDPGWIAQLPTNLLASNAAYEFGFGGPAMLLPTACAAGNYAIGYGFDQLQLGRADVMVVGGVDAISRIAFTGFNRLFAVAPEKCQPFDKNRKGMMVGEGAGIMVLETLERALERKAPIYAEILGYGMSCDAHHMTIPEVSGVIRVMQIALESVSVKPQEVDYLNAHGTGTIPNDKTESAAIWKVFGDYTKALPVSSIKSMMGHTMGAASALEAIATALAIKNDLIPPTINFETKDPECNIDCVPNVARRKKVNIALSNSFAFGGNNAALVLKKLGQ